MPSFSALDRDKHLSQLVEESWDLLIIGGGITGAGILLDAVSRGLKAALVEKRDFAWGTSSRSTKLIHGGLRYLKQFEIGLVREVGRERAIVHKNARHIVRPEKMILPMYKNGSLNKLSGGFGLWVYDFLANVGSDEKRKMLSAEEIKAMEPLLKDEGLTGGAVYYEYRTDDARLTIENVKTAVDLGGLAINYCECTDFHYDSGGRINGATCRDIVGDHELMVNAKAVINAGGPWVDDVRMLEPGKNQRKLFLTNGLHIVVPHDRLPLSNSLYFDTDIDNRMIFAITREDHVYLGTTDVAYEGDTDDPTPTNAEQNYILESAMNRFPGVTIEPEDIVSTWSGLRPLIYKEGKSPSDLSRKDEIFISDSGLLSIAGGKLTGYRKMAERALDKLDELHGLGLSPCRTDEISLTGNGTSSEENLLDERNRITNEARGLDLPRHIATKWHMRYGTNAFAILQNLKSVRESHGESKYDWLKAEVDYCIENEMVRTSEDFGLLRTAMVHFEPGKWQESAEVVRDHIESRVGTSMNIKP